MSTPPHAMLYYPDTQDEAKLEQAVTTLQDEMFKRLCPDSASYEAADVVVLMVPFAAKSSRNCSSVTIELTMNFGVEWNFSFERDLQELAKQVVTSLPDDLPDKQRSVRLTCSGHTVVA